MFLVYYTLYKLVRFLHNDDQNLIKQCAFTTITICLSIDYKKTQKNKIKAIKNKTQTRTYLRDRQVF